MVDGEWLRADGTTLGADNGIGMAASLAVMVNKDLVRPVEALFTVDGRNRPYRRQQPGRRHASARFSLTLTRKTMPRGYL